MTGAVIQGARLNPGGAIGANPALAVVVEFARYLHIEVALAADIALLAVIEAGDLDLQLLVGAKAAALVVHRATGLQLQRLFADDLAAAIVDAAGLQRDAGSAGQLTTPVVQLAQLGLHLAGAVQQPGLVVQFDGAERQVAPGQHPAPAVVQHAGGDTGIVLGAEGATLVVQGLAGVGVEVATGHQTAAVAQGLCRNMQVASGIATGVRVDAGLDNAPVAKLATTGKANLVARSEALVVVQVTLSDQGRTAAGVGLAGQLGALRIHSQIAAGRCLGQDQLAVGVDLDITATGGHVARQPHANARLGTHQANGAGVHAAQGGTVYGQFGLCPAIVSTRGRREAVGLHIITTGDDVQVPGMQFGVEPGAASDQVELVDVAGIEASAFDGNVTTVHLEAIEPSCFDHGSTGAQGGARGVDETAAATGDAVGVGDYDPRRLASDFGIAGQAAAVATGDFVEDGAGGTALEIGVAEDDAPQLGGLGLVSGVVEDQALLADVVLTEFVVGQPAAVGRGDIDHRHAIAGLSQLRVTPGGLVHRQFGGGSDDRIEKQDTGQRQGNALVEGAANVHVFPLRRSLHDRETLNQRPLGKVREQGEMSARSTR
ncbi:hypothetical protein D9M70_260720 [compost metagenome]